MLRNFFKVTQLVSERDKVHTSWPRLKLGLILTFKHLLFVPGDQRGSQATVGAQAICPQSNGRKAQRTERLLSRGCHSFAA